MNKFSSRIQAAAEAENRVRGFLLWNGKSVYNTGLEFLLPVWVHNGIKFCGDYDEFLETVRHFPDLATDKVLIQVKNAPSENKYKNVPIERACYNASLRIRRYGFPVLMIWMFADKSLHGSWVETLRVQEKPGSNNGSGTPMFLISKDQLKPIRNYLDKL